MIFGRNVLETIMITHYKPSLNVQEQSVPYFKAVLKAGNYIHF